MAMSVTLGRRLLVSQFNKIISAAFSAGITPPLNERGNKSAPIPVQISPPPSSAPPLQARRTTTNGMHLQPQQEANNKVEDYLVYLGARKYNDVDFETTNHHELLALVLGSKKAAEDAMICCFTSGFSGFSARMTRTQALNMKEIQSVVCVLSNKHQVSHGHVAFEVDWKELPVELRRNENRAVAGFIYEDISKGDGAITVITDPGMM